MILPSSLTSNSPQPPQPGSHPLARMALGLSIFAFIPPLGIAAIVLAQMTDKRIASGAGSSNGEVMAKAALRIAYLQLALVTITALFTWGVFRDLARGFQRDAMVQQVFRTNDQSKPLDAQAAGEAEQAAQAMVYQLVAIEDQVRRHREDGAYSCRVEDLIETGAEGSTDAQKRAFAARIAGSPYIYDITNCNPRVNGVETAAYVLNAIPRPPRLPDASTVFCTDQTGVVRSLRGGTSLDCWRSGEAVH